MISSRLFSTGEPKGTQRNDYGNLEWQSLAKRMMKTMGTIEYTIKEKEKMPKISFMGAGSFVFAKRLLEDIFSYPELRESEIILMDTDQKRLKLISQWAGNVILKNKFSTHLTSTLDRKEALKGADFVISMFDVGGLETRELDIKIPLKYKVPQAIGDTLGPGGFFKGLRLIPPLLELARNMEKICPQAFLLNYTNPMAINCRAVNRASKIKCVGLCHGLEHSKEFLAEILNVPYPELSSLAAGINHMTWLLTLEYKGKNLYPELKRKIEDPEIFSLDPIRFELLKILGYFMTESSYHISEYLPFFKDRFSRLSAVHQNKTKNFPPQELKSLWETGKTGFIFFLLKKKRCLRKFPFYGM